MTRPLVLEESFYPFWEQPENETAPAAREFVDTLQRISGSKHQDRWLAARAFRQAMGVAARAIAVKRHGTAASVHRLVPEFLSELPLDPFTGEPLRLLQKDSRIVVYGVGRNGRDDRGENGDVVFNVSR